MTLQTFPLGYVCVSMLVVVLTMRASNLIEYITFFIPFKDLI